jgi:hypothetical protein
LGGLLIISEPDEAVILTKGKNMSNTVEQLKAAMEEFLAEDAKFVAGNNAAGTRARKALQEVGKAVKARRNEITEEKNARKEAKSA